MALVLTNVSNLMHRMVVGEFRSLDHATEFLAQAGITVIHTEQDDDGCFDIMAARGKLELIQYTLEPQEA